MRSLVAFTLFALVSAPAAAAAPASAPAPAEPAPVAPAPAAPAGDSDFEIPKELTDPAMADTLSKMLGALTKVMMDMPVGEMQAAAEGRAPTAADKARTVRDLAGRDPGFERKVEQQIAATMPRMQATMKAMAKSLPAMAKGMEKVFDQMESTLDRATANIPQPGYPKR